MSLELFASDEEDDEKDEEDDDEEEEEDYDDDDVLCQESVLVATLSSGVWLGDVHTFH